ncbi:hypothetical protein [Methylocapsa aurea]|uniref:hypothetical protein n=1 Tax=Methylocapsa aurea TaxID=663610 RepID=UPI0012EB5DEA|nr:hypothetical protein [Methylocapsa aurea]
MTEEMPAGEPETQIQQAPGLQAEPLSLWDRLIEIVGKPEVDDPPRRRPKFAVIKGGRE